MSAPETSDYDYVFPWPAASARPYRFRDARSAGWPEAELVGRIRPRRNQEAIQVYVCHLKSKSPTRVFDVALFDGE